MKTNRFELLMLGVVLFYSQMGFSQKDVHVDDFHKIGESHASFRYKLEIVNDTSKKERKDIDYLILQIGEGLSRSYSFHLYQHDSLCSAWVYKGKDAVPSKPGNFSFPIDVYKNHAEQKITVLHRSPGTGPILQYVETLPLMQWEILPDSKVVLGYSCRKATCVFKGRTWNAWFTTDIPYSEGPWKFCGLPGLILQVEDERGWFSFICNAISNSKEDILMMEDRYYQQSTCKEVNELVDLFYYDALSYLKRIYPEIEQAPVVSKQDASGKLVRVKNTDNMKITTPYNPIELE